MSEVFEKCSICGIEMDNPNDATTENCGGDCLYCMYESGDPDAMMGIVEIYTKKIDKLQKQLKDANEVIAFYGSPRAWIFIASKDSVEITGQDVEITKSTITPTMLWGGKKAREYQERWK